MLRETLTLANLLDFVVELGGKIGDFTDPAWTRTVFRETLLSWDERMIELSLAVREWDARERAHESAIVANPELQDRARTPSGSGWFFRPFRHTDNNLYSGWFPPDFSIDARPIAQVPLPLQGREVHCPDRQIELDDEFAIAAAIHDTVFAQLPNKLNPWFDDISSQLKMVVASGRGSLLPETPPSGRPFAELLRQVECIKLGDEIQLRRLVDHVRTALLESASIEAAVEYLRTVNKPLHKAAFDATLSSRARVRLCDDAIQGFITIQSRVVGTFSGDPNATAVTHRLAAARRALSELARWSQGCHTEDDPDAEFVQRLLKLKDTWIALDDLRSLRPDRPERGKPKSVTPAVTFLLARFRRLNKFGLRGIPFDGEAGLVAIVRNDAVAERLKAALFPKWRKDLIFMHTHAPMPTDWAEKASGMLLEQSSQIRRHEAVRDLIDDVVRMARQLDIELLDHTSTTESRREPDRQLARDFESPVSASAADLPEAAVIQPPVLRPKIKSPDEAAQGAERLSQIPQLDRQSRAWVKAETAGDLDGVTVRTLATYRNQGIASPDGMSGVDRDGRQWRKAGTSGSHPWYLKSSLRSQKTGPNS